MMSTILKLCLSLGLLAIFVHAHTGDFKARLNEMAAEKTKVAGEFRLYEHSFIDREANCFICNGERVFDRKPVALKFMKNRKASEREFAMYSYLQAMEKPGTLERFGFANVYHYGEWEGYYLLVLSYFNGGFLSEKRLKPYFKTDVGIETINGLLLFRNFVRQSKYMHCHGIRHDNICPQNIMLRSNQTFLVNFNSGSKMFEDNRQGTPKYAARAFHSKQIRTAFSDWESFLYTMCDLYDIELYWFSHNLTKNEDYLVYKSMPNLIMKAIEKSIKAIHLRTVFLNFANEIFTKEHIRFYPDYNHIDKLINHQIEHFLKNKMRFELFSWITPERPIFEIDKNFTKPKFEIEKEIIFPRSVNFRSFKYPTVNTKYFSEANLAKSVTELIRQCVEGSMPASKRMPKSRSLD